MTDEEKVVVDSEAEAPTEEKSGVVVESTYVPMNATSFVELDEYILQQEASARMTQLLEQYKELTWNILHYSSPEGGKPIEKVAALRRLTDELDDRLKQALEDTQQKGIGGMVKAMFDKAITKNEGGVEYRASDYAFVPDPKKPSTWKLRLAEGKSGNVTKAQLGRAAAAFSSGGFRGNRVQVPRASVPDIKRRIRNAYARLGVKEDEIPESVKATNSFMVWKEGDRYRWLAIYSNRYQDEDNPPEIVSSEAHKTFVKSVEEGVNTMPELWHFHVPGTRWGEADWLAYDEDNGFSLASGLVDTGHEKEAEALAVMSDIAVSHGMTQVEYDPDEEHVISRYVSVEISDLPLEFAANKLTGFNILKEGEVDMGIPEAKKNYLRQAGLTDEKIDGIESDLANKALEASEAGLAFKGDGEERRLGGQAVGAPAEEAAPAEATPEPVEEPEPELEGEEKAVTRGEVAEAVLEATKPLYEAVDKLTTIVGKMAKNDEERLVEKVADTPAASISALVMRGLSIKGNQETLVDGRTSLAKDGPQESESPAETITGLPWLDKMLAQ